MIGLGNFAENRQQTTITQTNADCRQRYSQIEKNVSIMI